MKLYKMLQIWSPPLDDKASLQLIEDLVTKVLKRTDASEKLNKSNI